jgi:nitrogen-specific signal transduction histidine kinase/FixJ family two-component response regulator
MNKILIIDDNPTIHEDIRKILCPAKNDPAFSELASAFFDAPTESKAKAQFEIDSALQGQEGFAKVEKALAEGVPYSLAFVDMRMPPGWDGIETIRQIWNKYPELQVVICTAYSDHSWTDITQVLGHSDNLVILKKPFDIMELQQLAHALTKKWELNRQVQDRMANLDGMVRARTDELRASEERFQKAFQAASVPMAILRSQTQTCVEVNDSFLTLTARQRQEIIGPSPANLEQLIYPADYERLCQQLQRGGPVRDYDCRVRRNCKETRDALISAEPIKLGADECLLLALHDMTEQRQLESQLRQSQKMEAVGQLAAGIAHDFNNLLTIIQGYASIGLMRKGLEPKVADAFEQVQSATRRAAGLTRHLLAFSRKQVMQRKPLQLNETLTRMHPMLLRMIGEHVALECKCQPELPSVLGDENTIEQVLMNLVVNARDAMLNGGKLRIATESVELDCETAKRSPDARAGKFICLSVADNGEGMDASTLARVFEPFFTTKPQGKGTGLGLSTVYGIVKQHEGWLEVESTPQAGSTFRVFFPLSEQPAATPLLTPPLPEPREGKKPGETILVVEDEEPVRHLVATTLAQHGFEVLQAEDGLSALKIWQQAARPIDLLLTDMLMPNGLSGAALARQLVEKSSQLRVLYTSGYSPELIDNADGLIEGVNFLPKPFEVSKLIKAVQSCLASEAKAPLEGLL